MKAYEFFDHTADVGIAATGATLAEVFEAAAEGLAAILCDPETVIEREELEIETSAPDVESLLVAWLNEVNYLFEVRGFAFRSFEVREIGQEDVYETVRAAVAGAQAARENAMAGEAAGAASSEQEGDQE